LPGNRVAFKRAGTSTTISETGWRAAIAAFPLPETGRK
jgi:hypothetical protein